MFSGAVHRYLRNPDGLAEGDVGAGSDPRFVRAWGMSVCHRFVVNHEALSQFCKAIVEWRSGS